MKHIKCVSCAEESVGEEEGWWMCSKCVSELEEAFRLFYRPVKFNGFTFYIEEEK